MKLASIWLIGIMHLGLASHLCHANEVSPAGETSIQVVKKIHIGMPITEALKILGTPYREICSGVFCAEWKIDNGKFLYLWGVESITKIELNDKPIDDK